MLRLRFSFLALFFLLTMPLLAALSAGREIEVATRVVEPSPFYRGTPLVASNGRDFLVVWNDFDAGQRSVRAARVNAAGEVLDVAFIVAPMGAAVTGVASNGRNYVVAYDCGYSSTCIAQIDAASGAVTQTAMIANAGGGAIASNGNGYLLAYLHNARSTINAIPIHDDGTLAGEPFNLGYGGYRPAIASNGEHYYAVWSTYQQLVGRRFAAEGPLDELQVLTAQRPSWGPTAFGWTVASDGHDFLVSWQHNVRVVDFRYETTLQARVVSDDGLGEVHTVVAGEEAFAPAATWTGSQYLLTYSISRRAAAPYLDSEADADVRSVTVDRAGRPTAASVTLAGRPGREAESTAVSNGTSVLVAWQRVHSVNAAEIEGMLLGGAPFIISRSITWQASTTAATIGTRTVVAWDERLGEQQRRKVFLQRLDDDGQPLLGRGIGVADTAVDQLNPALGGSAIAWLQQEKDAFDRPASVHLRFFDGDGHLTLAAPLALGDAQAGSRIAVAAAGTTHLVVWTAPNGQIVGMRVSPERYLDLQPFVISRHDRRRAINPSIASDGRDFFVAWNVEEYGSGCGPCFPVHSISAAAVSAAGVIGTPFEVAASWSTRPSVVWNGAQYAAFWLRAGDGARSAFVQEFDGGGNAVGSARAIPLLREPLDVLWNGTEYVVATVTWDLRAGLELAVARFSRDLTLLELVPLVSRWRESTDVSIVARRDGGALLTYEADLDGTRTSRAVVRSIGEGLAIPRRRAVR